MKIFSQSPTWRRMKTSGVACCFSFLTGIVSVHGAGPIQRVPNTTLHMPQTPPVFGYAVTNAFGNLTFLAPAAITSPPGETNRLFVVEQGGRVSVITNLAA